MANRIEYQQRMHARMQDLHFRILSVRTRLSDGLDTATKALLSDELEHLEERRDDLAARVEALEAEPEAAWDELQAEIDQDWDMLVQDFEERLGGMAP